MEQKVRTQIWRKWAKLVIVAVGIGFIPLIRLLSNVYFVNGMFSTSAVVLIVLLGAIATVLYLERKKIKQENDELKTLLDTTTANFQQEKAEAQHLLKVAHEKNHKLEAKNIVLQETNRRKDEFLRQMSHELRTPMNGIIGSLQLLLDDLCDNRDEELELLQQAHQSSLHLLGLINQVLDLARIEAGKVTVDLKTVDLQASLTAAIYLQFSNIRQKGLQLQKTDSSGIIKVKADPNKLKQVFINIIGNAIKFTDQGSILIETQIKPVFLSSINCEKLMASVTIRDTGLGIEPEMQARLFKPFETEHNSTPCTLGSTGLGLVISKNLIELMGGQISMISPGRNQGTTVEICLLLVDNFVDG